jgi:hypothetical protein
MNSVMMETKPMETDVQPSAEKLLSVETELKNSEKCVTTEMGLQETDALRIV